MTADLDALERIARDEHEAIGRDVRRAAQHRDAYDTRVELEHRRMMERRQLADGILALVARLRAADALLREARVAVEQDPWGVAVDLLDRIDAHLALSDP